MKVQNPTILNENEKLIKSSELKVGDWCRLTTMTFPNIEFVWHPQHIKEGCSKIMEIEDIKVRLECDWAYGWSFSLANHSHVVINTVLSAE
jgi:hypothetical protein